MVDLVMIQNKAIELVIQYLPKVLLVIICLFVGLKIIKQLCVGLDKILKKRKLDVSLRKFIRSFVSVCLKFMLFISLASMLGVATTSFVAVIGATGLAIGLALQGSLGNFAGGVLILFFKPFIVGDLIESQGHTGKVEKIEIFNTILLTPDNKTVILPNGLVSNDPITNYSTQELRRVDLTIGIGYDDDIKKAEKVLKDILSKHKKVLKKPASAIKVSELADSSVNFAVRPWVKSDDYWDVYFDITREVKLTFDKEGISIPYPQRDIHMHQN
jgi:small conductance mechanosensitive channel